MRGTVWDAHGALQRVVQGMEEDGDMVVRVPSGSCCLTLESWSFRAGSHETYILEKSSQRFKDLV